MCVCVCVYRYPFAGKIDVYDRRVRATRARINILADTCCATFESRCTNTESNEAVDDEDEKNERNLLAAPSRRIASAGAARRGAFIINLVSCGPALKGG